MAMQHLIDRLKDDFEAVPEWLIGLDFVLLMAVCGLLS